MSASEDESDVTDDSTRPSNASSLTEESSEIIDPKSLRSIESVVFCEEEENESKLDVWIRERIDVKHKMDLYVAGLLKKRDQLIDVISKSKDFEEIASHISMQCPRSSRKGYLNLIEGYIANHYPEQYCQYENVAQAKDSSEPSTSLGALTLEPAPAKAPAKAPGKAPVTAASKIPSRTGKAKPAKQDQEQKKCQQPVQTKAPLPTMQPQQNKEPDHEKISYTIAFSSFKRDLLAPQCRPHIERYDVDFEALKEELKESCGLWRYWSSIERLKDDLILLQLAVLRFVNQCLEVSHWQPVVRLFLRHILHEFRLDGLGVRDVNGDTISFDATANDGKKVKVAGHSDVCIASVECAAKGSKLDLKQCLGFCEVKVFNSAITHGSSTDNARGQSSAESEAIQRMGGGPTVTVTTDLITAYFTYSFKEKEGVYHLSTSRTLHPEELVLMCVLMVVDPTGVDWTKVFKRNVEFGSTNTGLDAYARSRGGGTSHNKDSNHQSKPTSSSPSTGGFGSHWNSKLPGSGSAARGSDSDAVQFVSASNTRQRRVPMTLRPMTAARQYRLSLIAQTRTNYEALLAVKKSDNRKVVWADDLEKENAIERGNSECL